MNANADEFGMERLAWLIFEHRGRSADEMMHAIIDAVHEFVGSAEPFDDMTLVTVKRMG